jgi:hypothetical protein
MTKLTTFILFLFSCMFIAGCDIVNPGEEIPTYVHVDSFKFNNPNPNATGTGKQAITSVFAYVDGEALGVFELPADIPVNLRNTQQLQLSPGVNNQGLLDYQLSYPFFSFYNINVAAAPGTVINMIPETQYIADLKYWICDFESGNQFTRLSGDTSIRWVSGADSVFEGGKGGCISLGGGLSRAEGFAPISFTPGTQGYLELHYKGTLPFQVGILVAQSGGGFTQSYLAGVKAKDQWGKLYLNVQQFTSQFPDALKFSVIIQSYLEEGTTEGYVLLDNIKVISY